MWTRTKIIIATLDECIISFQVLPPRIKNVFRRQLILIMECQDMKGMFTQNALEIKQMTYVAHFTLCTIKVNNIVWNFNEYIHNFDLISNILHKI